MTVYNVQLQSIKKLERADLVVPVGGDASDGEPTFVERRVDPRKSHPLLPAAGRNGRHHVLPANHGWNEVDRGTSPWPPPAWHVGGGNRTRQQRPVSLQAPPYGSPRR